MQLIPHTLDDVADGPGLGVVLRTRAATASQPSLFHVSGIAGIADAKKKATIGKPRGDAAAFDSGLWTLQLRNAFSSASPLDGDS